MYRNLPSNVLADRKSSNKSPGLTSFLTRLSPGNNIPDSSCSSTAGLKSNSVLDGTSPSNREKSSISWNNMELIFFHWWKLRYGKTDTGICWTWSHWKGSKQNNAGKPEMKHHTLYFQHYLHAQQQNCQVLKRETWLLWTLLGSMYLFSII